MKKLDINDRARCATCGVTVTHKGPNWESIGESIRKSALGAPNPDSPTYKNIVAEVDQTKRSGGWEHLFRDLTHDPVPHDGRTMEEERDRIQRGINASTDANLQRFKTPSTPPLSDKQQKGEG